MKPILFNTEMVRAILDGRKTETRRVIKFKPGMTGWLPSDGSRDYLFYPGGIKYPPYCPGDILYVRETFCGWYLPGGAVKYCYKATDPNGNQTPTGPEYDDEWDVRPWRPSIHMPKEAARLFLRVTDVSVERLQDITPKQAYQEGVGKLFIEQIAYGRKDYENPVDKDYGIAKEQFAFLWDSTIKKSDLDRYGWAANPFVWVIEFERVKDK